MNAPEPFGVSINEAARILGIGRTKLYELLDARLIERRKIGSRTIVLFASLRAFINSDRPNES